MKRIKHPVFVSILITLLVLGMFSFALAADDDQGNPDSGDNFPADKAGIAAYVKLDAPADQMAKVLTDALNYYSIRETPVVDSNYVIGVVEIENKSPDSPITWKDYPHLYIGLDGWMVAYYLKDEEASHIMQWKGYTPGEIKTTTLKDAIDKMCQNLEVSYLGDVRYYDFAYPQATKMTLVAETVPVEKNVNSNSFSVIIPGTLYEASYMTHMHCGYSSCSMKLVADGITVIYRYSSPNYVNDFLDYGYYSSAIDLKPNIPHLISFSNTSYRASQATVFIYGN